MLMTMLKHEWKATWKMLALLNIATLALALIGRIILIFESSIPEFIAAIYLVVFFFMIIASSCATFIILVLRYYRNLYTDEGYLTNTLPVSAATRLNAKIINHMAWFFLNILCIIAAFAIFVSAEVPMSDMWTGITNVASMLPQFFAVNAALFWILMLVTMIISSLMTILMFYFSISVGCCFNTHKVLASVVSYLITYVVLQIVSSIIMVVIGLNYGEVLQADVPLNVAGTTPQLLPFFHTTMIVAIVICVVVNIIFYLVSHYLLAKKLNLN